MNPEQIIRLECLKLATHLTMQNAQVLKVQASVSTVFDLAIQFEQHVRREG